MTSTASHRNRASQKVDMRSLAYTVELFDLVERLPRRSRVYSGWEFQRNAEDIAVYMAAFAR
ncbi:MAG: hypothetical protein A2W25_13945 [candidate division Zixibacteria bacterium RBG_16_53_22]|nr:MAG: hypothetical protein A2W25_13945 [candidate division Zixibacteria bacterium RBG_16_53_22]